MEIVLLLVLWAIAAFASDNSVSLFLVFLSMGVIAWRWRAKQAQLQSKLEQNGHDADSLRAELRQVTQELRLLKSALAAPAAQPGPGASQTGTDDMKPVAVAQPQPTVTPTAPRPGSIPEQKPSVAPPPRVEPRPPVTAPVATKPIPPTPAAPPKVPAPVSLSESSVAVPHASAVSEQKPAVPVVSPEPPSARITAPPPPALKIPAAPLRELLLHKNLKSLSISKSLSDEICCRRQESSCW